MKMTIEIPEDVLAELMRLTGLATKREAVEFALRDAARRAQWRRVVHDGLAATPDELAADAATKPSDAIDSPDIDEAAVDRAFAAHQRRLARKRQLSASGFAVNEDPPVEPAS